MKDQPLVSVIIPTHNGEKYIKRAVESVINQTHQNIEIIIIDDGSEDKTSQIIFELGKRDLRINALKNQINLGFVKTLNRGIQEAKGEYIARLDDDDYWCDIKKLEKQVGFLEAHPEYVLVGGGLVRIDSNGKEIIRYLFPEKDEIIRKVILTNGVFAHSAVIFKRHAVLQSGGYDEQFGFFADSELWLKLGKLGKLYNFSEYFIYYLDKENDKFNYGDRDNLIRRKLWLNIRLRRKYRNDYPGYWKSVIFCFASYFYSFLPYRRRFWLIIFKLRILFFGPLPYKYFKSNAKDENKN